MKPGSSELKTLQQKIRNLLVPSIRPLGTEGKLYTYLDADTERTFMIRRLGENRANFSYFLEELVPTGMVMCGDAARQEYVFDERIQNTEKSKGPNPLVSECRSMGIDASKMGYAGSGYSVDSRYHKSLISCVKAIANVILSNVRYKAHRELTNKEKADLEFEAKVSSVNYYEAQHKKAVQASNHGVGALKGCYNMFGPLSKEKTDSILSYLNAPSERSWNELRSTVIGSSTLWQAWVAFDSSAPSSGCKGFPSPDVLRDAIKAEVDSNKRKLEAKINECGSVALRACK